MANLQSAKANNETPDVFKWKHFSADIILWTVRWYCQFALSYRDIVLMVEERGLSATHTTLMRWVHQYAPELQKRMKPHLKMTNDSWRIDEMYIKIKGCWYYLYRAVDSDGNTLDWMLSKTCDQEAAKRFFKKMSGNEHFANPRVVSVDKNAAYPPAFEACQANDVLEKKAKLRQSKYLNNVIEADHRFVKRRVRHSQWLQTFRTAEWTVDGYESIYMMRKGQIKNVGRKNVVVQIKFIEELFGIAA